MRYKLFFCTAGLFVSLNATSLRATVINWTNINGGFWSVPSNWSTHTVPGNLDSVFIDVAGTYTVTVDTAVIISSLTLGGASGQQTLTNNNQNVTVGSALVSAAGVLSLGGSTWSGGPVSVVGTLNWSGGTLAAPLTVDSAGTLNINGAAVTLQHTLTNSGTIHWSGSSSSITIYNNTNLYFGFLHNQPGALIDIQNDSVANCACYGFEGIVNAGTLRKSAGVGITTFNVAFTNIGLVDAQSATINFGAGGNIGGSYNTASNTTIQFVSGNFVETGTVTNTGSGTFRQNGANVTLNDRITKFILFNGNVSLSPTFQGTGTIQNLQLDGASLVGTNYVSGTLGFDGGGLGSASPLTVDASGVLLFNGASVNIYSPLTNLGTINWSGGSLSLANNAGLYTGVVYNQPGALFNIQNDQSVTSAGYGPEYFRNNGTLRKTAGLGVTSFNLSFTNTGTVDAQTGIIQFAGGGNIGGHYNTASGAVIQFASGNFTQTGPVTVTGSGLSQQTGGTVTLSDQIANFSLTGGNVALSPAFQTNGTIQSLQLHGVFLTGTNVVTGTLGFDGGGLGSASPLTVSNNATLNFNGASVSVDSPLTNLGTINWSGGSISVANNGSLYTGAIYNQPGGLLNILNDQNLTTAGYGPEFFNNAGTVRKNAGLGVTTFSLTTTNTGLFDAQSGAIHFTGGGTIAGSYNTALGALIEFDGGNFFESGAVTVTGSGICRENGATVTLNDRIANFILAGGTVVLSPTFQSSGAIQSLQLDGAFLAGANRVTGTLGFNGGGLAQGSSLTVAPTGVLNFNGAAVSINAPLTNSGTINWSSGGLSIADNGGVYTGILYNQNLFNLQCDQNLNSAGYGPELFVNTGTLRKTQGRGTTTISVSFTNMGTLDAQSGIIRIGSAYTQTGGTMNFGISSLAFFGQIAFNATAPFTGTLSVNFNDGYFPSAGDSFPLVTYTARSGIFTALALPPQAQWQTNYSPGIFTLTVLSASNVLPITLTPISYAAGTFSLQLNGSVGPSYILQASTNFIDWVSLDTNTPGSMPFTITDPNAGKFNRRFYRAQLGP